VVQIGCGTVKPRRSPVTGALASGKQQRRRAAVLFGAWPNTPAPARFQTEKPRRFGEARAPTPQRPVQEIAESSSQRLRSYPVPNKSPGAREDRHRGSSAGHGCPQPPARIGNRPHRSRAEPSRNRSDDIADKKAPALGGRQRSHGSSCIARDRQLAEKSLRARERKDEGIEHRIGCGPASTLFGISL
jgi:hypothetical protein